MKIENDKSSERPFISRIFNKITGLFAKKSKKKLEPEDEPGFFSTENLTSISILLVVVFAIRWSIASPYYVPTASMEPTIKVGDRLLALKLAYGLRFPFTNFMLMEWGTPQRGDIIVFEFPKDQSINYVKRVVGVAGDKLRIIEDVLYVNDEPQYREDFNFDRSVLEDIDDNKNLKLLFQLVRLLKFFALVRILLSCHQYQLYFSHI